MDRSAMDDAYLERALRAFGRELAFPTPVDVTDAVRAQIEAGPVKVIDLRRRSRAARWQPAAAAIFVLLLVGALTLTAAPGLRQAVADLLGFEKLRIEVGDDPVPELGQGLALGVALTIAEAEERFGGPVPVADRDRYGAPDGVYFAGDEVPMVHVVYGPAPGLPATSRAGVSVLVSALDAELFRGFGEKVLDSGEATVSGVTVRGRGGFWIEGRHGFFVYSTNEGLEHVESARIADNVLIWQEGSVIYRVEGAMSRADAVGFAEGLELDG